MGGLLNQIYFQLFNGRRVSGIHYFIKKMYVHLISGRIRLGAGHLGAWTIGRHNTALDYCRFFLASFFCSYVVSVCSSLRSR